MGKRLRKTWLQVHRWVGLSVGAVFVLLGLTGSVLVFDHAIDEWLNPHLLLTRGSGDKVPLQQVIESAESHYASKSLSVTRPRIDDGVWTVWFQAGTEDNPRFAQVMVDPYTGQVTGQRVWGEYLLTWLYRLHFRMFAGTVGGVLVGACGIFVLFSIISGVLLWWPLWKHSLRAAFAVRSGKVNYDLHKTLGIGGGLLLTVLCLTGVYMEFPQWINVALEAVSDVSAPPLDIQSNSALSTSMLTADEAIAAASKLFPDAVFDHLHPPASPQGTYEVAFRQAGEVQQSYGRTQVFLDPYSGEPILVRTPQDDTVADKVILWQFPLHNGEAFGLVGRWIVFISGLLPAILYGTGLRIWLRRRRLA